MLGLGVPEQSPGSQRRRPREIRAPRQRLQKVPPSPWMEAAPSQFLWSFQDARVANFGEGAAGGEAFLSFFLPGCCLPFPAEDRRPPEQLQL